jgi:pimeloyl-ACP methyl ester carboxylesterase
VITKTPDGENVFFSIEGSGPAILFVHGAASDADAMAPLVSELSGRYRCISVDRLGYRRSSRLRRDTTVDEQAHAIEAVRKACTSDPLWMFGHSSGGNVAVGMPRSFRATFMDWF